MLSFCLPSAFLFSNATEAVLRGKIQHIEFVNNRFLSHKELLNITGLAEGVVLPNEGMLQTVKLIESIYKNNGFYFVDVTYTYHRDENDGVALRLNISEGSRVRIEAIHIEGVSQVSVKKLMKRLDSRPGLLRKEFLTETLLERDRVSIEAFYRDRGLSATVREIVRDFSEDGESVVLHFIVSEDSFADTVPFQSEIGEVNNAELNEDIELDSRPEFKSADQTSIGLEFKVDDEWEVDVPNSPIEIENEESHVKNEESGYKQSQEQDANLNNPVTAAKSQPQVNTRDLIENAERQRILNEKLSLEQELERLRKVLADKEEVESLLSGLLASEKNEKNKLRNNLESLEVQNSTLKKEIENKSSEINQLKVESKKLKSEIKEVNSQMKEDNLKSESLAKLMNIRLEKMIDIQNQLSSVIRETQSAISKELDKIELSQIDVSETKVEANELNEPMPVLKKETKQVKTVEIAEEQKSGLSGSVVVVNDQLNFLVVNLGAANGAYMGMKLSVTRNNREIAKVKIFEVRKSISAVEILSSNQKVETGDKVIEILS